MYSPIPPKFLEYMFPLFGNHLAKGVVTVEMTVRKIRPLQWFELKFSAMIVKLFVYRLSVLRSSYAIVKGICPDLPVFSDPIRAYAGRRNGRRQFGSSFYDSWGNCPAECTICPRFRGGEDPFRRSAPIWGLKMHFSITISGRSTEGVFQTSICWANGAQWWAVVSSFIKLEPNFRRLLRRLAGARIGSESTSRSWQTHFFDSHS